jgi:hypothetical protein
MAEELSIYSLEVFYKKTVEILREDPIGLLYYIVASNHAVKEFFY